MSGLLCLKWNNHSSSLLKKLNVIYSKEVYCDATIACQGKYYPVHRLVLSTCSEYFEEIFERTHCKHPFIIVKDIDPLELEALLSYMYNGEVNVIQETLPGLIKAAETLRIKGLAVSDEPPPESPYTLPETKKRSNSSISNSHSKRACRRLGDSNERPSVSQSKNYSLENSTSNSFNEPVSRKCEKEPPVPENRTEIPVSEIKVEAFDNTESNEGNLVSSYDSTSNSNLFAPDETPPVYSPPMDSPSSPLLPSEPSENQASLVKPEIDAAQCSSLNNNNVNVDSNFGALPGEAQEKWTAGSKGASYSSSSSNSVDTSAATENNYLDVTQRILQSSRRLSLSPKPPNYYEERRYPCLYCSLRFQNKTNLNHHLNVHTGERPYPCPQCPYKATQLHNLKKHLLTHSGEKPFKCPLCEYTSSQNTNIKRHMKKHHPGDPPTDVPVAETS